MLKIYLTGLALGIALPQYLSLNDYQVLYQGLYKPHKDFNTLKRNLYKKDISLDEKHYFDYFKNTVNSFIQTVYYFPYGKYREALHQRQKACYKLIQNFEFVKETIENMDYITENLRALEKYQANSTIVPGTYEHLKLIEKQAKSHRVTADDNNLENLERIKAMTKDDYEKYLLDQAIVDKGDYMNSLSPELKVEKEQNKIKLLQSYYDSMKQFKEERQGGDIDEKSTLYRNRMNNLAMNKWHESEEKRLQKEREHKKQEKKETPKEIGEFKQSNPKSVEQELQMLKEIFGNK